MCPTVRTATNEDRVKRGVDIKLVKMLKGMGGLPDEHRWKRHEWLG